MDISLFRMPKDHPYDLLGNYEKEGMLRFALEQCIIMGGWGVFATKYDHPEMVKDGLFEETDNPHIYRLTEKAKGLLYSVYHK